MEGMPSASSGAQEQNPWYARLLFTLEKPALATLWLLIIVGGLVMVAASAGPVTALALGGVGLPAALGKAAVGPGSPPDPSLDPPPEDRKYDHAMSGPQLRVVADDDQGPASQVYRIRMAAKVLLEYEARATSPSRLAPCTSSPSSADS
jgi:hypothetical protein